jgi:hypothetical protein
LQRHSSALALAGLTTAGLTLGGALAFDVNPAIEATHDAIVATRRLEQHHTALGLALLRVGQGLSDDQAGDDGALVAAVRTVEKESELETDLLTPTLSSAADRRGEGVTNVRSLLLHDPHPKPSPQRLRGRQVQHLVGRHDHATGKT